MLEGTAAGTILRLHSLLILFNGAGPNQTQEVLVTKPLTKRRPIGKAKVLWIDDVTVCTAIDLKSSLVAEDRPVPRPLQYHARTEHMLPRNLNTMQDKIDNLTEYTDNHLMSINTKKMKAVLCNSSRKWDFITDQNIQREDRNEMLNEIKVVGFILRNNMKKYSNTSYIRGKAY